jgi:hypothetical protein
MARIERRIYEGVITFAMIVATASAVDRTVVSFHSEPGNMTRHIIYLIQIFIGVIGHAAWDQMRDRVPLRGKPEGEGE